MLQTLRIRISYRFLHTITILASILHSLHGLPATDVFSNEDNEYELGSLFNPNKLNPNATHDDRSIIDLEEYGWEIGMVITLVLLGGIFAGTFVIHQS
jgi:hypothetical protein